MLMGVCNFRSDDELSQNFSEINGFKNLIKGKSCFKCNGSSIDLILKRKYSFENHALLELE